MLTTDSYVYSEGEVSGYSFWLKNYYGETAEGQIYNDPEGSRIEFKVTQPEYSAIFFLMIISPGIAYVSLGNAVMFFMLFYTVLKFNLPRAAKNFEDDFEHWLKREEDPESFGQ